MVRSVNGLNGKGSRGSRIESWRSDSGDFRFFSGKRNGRKETQTKMR